MDITSFILGRINGRDSVKTQEKTVTPGENEIVVTPDIGYDALSKVIVEAIETGGSSESEDAVWAVASGNFKPTGVVMTCNHDLGVVPEILLAYAGHIPGGSCLFFAIGFSASMTKLFEDSAYPGVVGVILSTGGFMSLQSNLGMETNGDSGNMTGAQKGVIRNVTDSTFTVGGTMVNTGLNVGEQYYWRAYYKKPASE